MSPLPATLSMGAPQTLEPEAAAALLLHREEAGIAAPPDTAGGASPLAPAEDAATEEEVVRVVAAALDALRLDCTPICARMLVTSPSLVVVAWIVVLPSRQLFRAFWA